MAEWSGKTYVIAVRTAHAVRCGTMHISAERDHEWHCGPGPLMTVRSETTSETTTDIAVRDRE